MNYEVVTLQEKKMAGLSARTANNDPEMYKIVGGLWQKLFGEGIFFTIPAKVNDHSIGLYSDYDNGADGNYNITVGCEVSSTETLPEQLICKTMPAGKYAKFVVYGDEVQAVGNAWQEVWNTPLERTFTGDFEEYLAVPEGEPKEIHIFVAIK